MTDERRLRAWLGYLPLVGASAAATLLLAAITIAFGTANRFDLDGTQRFRQLGEAANPFVAFLALAAVAAVVRNRANRAGDARTDSIALATATVVALLVALLALNGIVVHLTTGDNGALIRLGAILQLLTSLGLAGVGLLLAATAPTPRESPPVESPPPSPPDGAGPESRP